MNAHTVHTGEWRGAQWRSASLGVWRAGAQLAAAGVAVSAPRGWCKQERGLAAGLEGGVVLAQRPPQGSSGPEDARRSSTALSPWTYRVSPPRPPGVVAGRGLRLPLSQQSLEQGLHRMDDGLCQPVNTRRSHLHREQKSWWLEASCGCGGAAVDLVGSRKVSRERIVGIVRCVVWVFGTVAAACVPPEVSRRWRGSRLGACRSGEGGEAPLPAFSSFRAEVSGVSRPAGARSWSRPDLHISTSRPRLHAALL